MKKNIIIIFIALLLLPIKVMAFTVTLYDRQDLVLSETNSSTNDNFTTHAIDLSAYDGWYDASVYVVHADTSEDTLGTNIAQVVRSINFQGTLESSNTWNCPATNLAITDKIKVVIRVSLEGSYVVTRTFTSAALGYSKLNAATWTFYYWTLYDIRIIPPMPRYISVATIFHGDSTNDSRITGISYNLSIGSYAFLM